VHQKVVEAKDELKISLVDGHTRLVDGHNKAVGDFKEAVRAAPWVTPRTLDETIKLPTLEQLFAAPCEVGHDGLVAQYIYAHEKIMLKHDDDEKDASVGTVLKSLVQGGKADDASRYSKPVGAFESEHGYCRLCPEFSMVYGHRVYICKRPIPA